MNLDDITRASEFTLAITGAIVAITAIIRKVYRTARSVDETLKTVERMEKQLFPNGGSTVRDSLDRIERTLVDHASRMTVVEGYVRRQEQSRSSAEAA